MAGRLVLSWLLAILAARSTAAQPAPAMAVVKLPTQPAPVAAKPDRCPSLQYLPQLTISAVREPAVPVIDEWQVMFRDVPISDAQLAALAHDDPAIELTREEMESRGTWVYLGMVLAAVGAVVSSVGWYLYGRHESSVSLSMALGGFAVGGGGTMLVAQSVERALEPHIAPTPEHRLSRRQVRRLVATVNRQLYHEICEAAAVP